MTDQKHLPTAQARVQHIVGSWQHHLGIRGLLTPQALCGAPLGVKPGEPGYGDPDYGAGWPTCPACAAAAGWPSPAGPAPRRHAFLDALSSHAPGALLGAALGIFATLGIELATGRLHRLTPAAFGALLTAAALAAGTLLYSRRGR